MKCVHDDRGLCRDCFELVGEARKLDPVAVKAIFETLKEKPRINEALATVSAALEPLDGEARGRVLRAVAVLLGIKGGVGP